MKRKVKHDPTEAQRRAAEEQDRREAFEREIRPHKALAARICLEQTLPLIGQDVPHQGICAEQMTLYGSEARFRALQVLSHEGVSEACLRDIVSGADLYISDRLCAAWWYYLRPSYHRVWKAADKDQWARDTFIRDIDEMVVDQTMHHDARALLRGTEDTFRYHRERARKEYAEFQAGLVALTKEPA